MWADWVVIEAIFIVLGALLVWAMLVGILAEHLHDYRALHHRRDRSGQHPSPR